MRTNTFYGRKENVEEVAGVNCGEVGAVSGDRVERAVWEVNRTLLPFRPRQERSL
jgi:hypothetical protein